MISWKLELMAPLTDLLLAKRLLSFWDYSLPFKIFCDALKSKVGSIIAQKLSKPVAFFVAKMTPAQCCYTVTEQELLPVVLTPKKYSNMLLSHHHKNFTFQTSS
jgi:RNase H-like domain found in reverse transcriptase